MKKSILISLFLFTQFVHADFFTAIEDYQSKNYEKAYNQFLNMAKLGEKRSQFNLAVMYFNGQFVERDLNTAFGWMKLAVDSETLSVEEREIFDTLKAEITDKKAAEEAYQQLNREYGTRSLSVSLYPTLVTPEKGKSFSAIPVKVRNPEYPRDAAIAATSGWVKIGFDLDNAGVPRNIHLIDDSPKGVFAREALKVIPQWKFKVEGGELARKRMNYFIEFKVVEGPQLSINQEKYQEVLKQAEQGIAEAQYTIGYLQQRHPHLIDNSNPTEWFLKAATQGHPEAQFYLAENLIRGKGCVEERDKGIEWLVQSSANGSQQAIKRLAIELSEQPTLNAQTQARSFFEESKDLNGYDKFVYARLLATSPFEQVRNPEKAIDIVDSISSREFPDAISRDELMAEAYFALGKFKKAKSYFKDAIDSAEDLEADTQHLGTRLAVVEDKLRKKK